MAAPLYGTLFNKCDIHHPYNQFNMLERLVKVPLKLTLDRCHGHCPLSARMFIISGQFFSLPLEDFDYNCCDRYNVNHLKDWNAEFWEFQEAISAEKLSHVMTFLHFIILVNYKEHELNRQNFRGELCCSQTALV